MRWKLRCPECQHVFVTRDDEAPCPQCGWKPESNVIEIATPFLSTAKSRSVDQVYRDIERGSEVRAQMAAERFGVPASDMASLKITNLRNAKEGETAAVPVNNTVTQFMASNKVGGFQADGSGYSGAVQSGFGANAGAHMRSILQAEHGRVSGGAAVSDRPANETLQPGYRRRG